MTTEPREEARELIFHNLEGAGGIYADEPTDKLVDALAAAIEVDRKNHPHFAGGDAIFMSRLDALRAALSALREDET